MAEVVLDASAVLALLNREPGCQAVAAALPGALVSAPNLAEVVGKLSEAGLPERAVREAVAALGLVLVPFDAELAYRAGLLRVSTRTAGLSLGDRACLALAAARGVPALTADRTWLDVAAACGVQVRSIR